MDLRTNVSRTPSLSEQTPGLETGRRIKSLALRAKAIASSRPRSFMGILGGLLVIGIGAFLTLRRKHA